ncbi:hypothetical protein C475_01571 [Halosimplex carlsbadense 2-9-1]|uniref:Uncharacterized protein n=1 Tax=Halosimplex carlsbadense 2-9-1 TaxID=797114 RepID=M0D4J3_9EURY|nr:hypothetical protein C475_01571 [Halosimplex carlsbadense 2-9-1]
MTDPSTERPERGLRVGVFGRDIAVTIVELESECRECECPRFPNSRDSSFTVDGRVPAVLFRYLDSGTHIRKLLVIE